MEGRVRGFVRALNSVLDDDEDLALCNLSKLISNPERFVQPVNRQVSEPAIYSPPYTRHQHY